MPFGLSLARESGRGYSPPSGMVSDSELWMYFILSRLAACTGGRRRRSSSLPARHDLSWNFWWVRPIHHKRADLFFRAVSARARPAHVMHNFNSATCASVTMLPLALFTADRGFRVAAHVEAHPWPSVLRWALNRTPKTPGNVPRSTNTSSCNDYASGSIQRLHFHILSLIYGPYIFVYR